MFQRWTILMQKLESSKFSCPSLFSYRDSSVMLLSDVNLPWTGCCSLSSRESKGRHAESTLQFYKVQYLFVPCALFRFSCGVLTCALLYLIFSAIGNERIESLIQEDQNVKRRRERYQKQSSLLSKLTRQLSIHDNRAAAASSYSDNSGTGKFIRLIIFETW